MPRYNPSHLERPSTLKEAVQVLKKWGPKARIVAGNTTVYELANQGGMDDVETIIDVSSLGLNYVTRDGHYLHLGSMTRFAELETSDIQETDSNFAVKETAMKLTPPQIRNMATIGGSVCSGIPFYDIPVTLLAQDAEFHVASSNGERKVHAQDFFIDYFMTSVSSEEMLIEIRCPERTRAGSAFLKLGRTSADFAVVNSSVMIAFEPKGKYVSDARIALGAVASTPIRMKAAEEFLVGKEPLKENLMKTASLCGKIEPTPSFHASSEYKKRVIPIIVRDTLYAAVKRTNRT